MPWWSLQKGKMQRCGDPMNQWILWILIKQCHHVASWTQEQTWCHQIFDLWMGFYGFHLSVAHSGLGCWRWSHHEGAQGSSEGAVFILQAFDFKFFNGIKMQFVSSIVNEMLMRRETPILRVWPSTSILPKVWRKNKSQQAKSLHSKQSRQHPGRLEKLIVLGLAWMKEGPFTLSLVRRKGISFIFLCFFSLFLFIALATLEFSSFFSLSTRLELFAHQLHVNDGFRSPTADPCPVKDNPLYRRPRGGKSFGSNTQLKMENCE